MVASGGSLPAAGRFDQSRRTRRNRVWSLLDFVPKALTFERADPGTITESTARPLDASAPVAATVGHGDFRIHAGGVRSCGAGTLIGIPNGGS